MIFMLQFFGDWKRGTCEYLQLSSESEVTSSFEEITFINVLLMPDKNDNVS